MTASGNGDWGTLEALWQRAALASDVLPTARARVAGRRRHLLLHAACDYVLLLAAIGLFVALVRHATSVERLVWAFGLPLFAVYAIAVSFDLRRELWHAAAESTETYVTLALARVERRLRLVARAWQLYGAMILLDAALWTWRYWSDPASLDALRERAVLAAFALSVFTVALAAWTCAYWWRGRAERSALAALRSELEPGA